MGVVSSWAQLKKLQTNEGFPLGFLLGANTRRWTDEEFHAWLASRPTAGPEPRGAAKLRRARKIEKQVEA
jgi:hypothetical protein